MVAGPLTPCGGDRLPKRDRAGTMGTTLAAVSGDSRNQIGHTPGQTRRASVNPGLGGAAARTSSMPLTAVDRPHGSRSRRPWGIHG